MSTILNLIHCRWFNRLKSTAIIIPPVLGPNSCVVKSPIDQLSKKVDRDGLSWRGSEVVAAAWAIANHGFIVAILSSGAIRRQSRRSIRRSIFPALVVVFGLAALFLVPPRKPEMVATVVCISPTDSNYPRHNENDGPYYDDGTDICVVHMHESFARELRRVTSGLGI